MSCYSFNEPPTPSLILRQDVSDTSSLNLRQGVSDTPSLRLNYRNDRDQDASSLRLYSRTSVARDARSLVIVNHEPSASPVRRRSPVHHEEYIGYEGEVSYLEGRIFDEEVVLEYSIQNLAEYIRMMHYNGATSRTDNPDTVSQPTATALHSQAKEEIVRALRQCRQTRVFLNRFRYRLDDDDKWNSNENARLRAGVARIQKLLKEVEVGSEELRGWLQELPRSGALYEERERNLTGNDLDLLSDAYGSARNEGGEKEGENLEESKTVPPDVVESMEYRAW